MQGRENLYNDPNRTPGFLRLDRVDSGNPASPWYLDRFQDFLRDCRDLLLEKIGSDKVKAIILGGSFATGEGTVVFEGEAPVLLSDVDLLVVMDSLPALLEVLPRRNDLGMACEEKMPETTFTGRVDVGAVLAGELPSFARSPGTFVLRTRGQLLYGEESVLDLFPGYDPEDISPRESLTLLENRMASILGDWPVAVPGTGSGLYRFFYRVSRSYTDILTAAAVASKSFVPGYQERWETMNRRYGSKEVDLYLDGTLLEKTRYWTAFKICPSFAEGEPDVHSLSGIWLETAADLFSMWEKCARTAYARELPARSPEDIKRIAETRAEPQGLMSRIRSWKRLMRWMDSGQRIRALSFTGGSVLKTDPGDFVRAASVHLLSVAPQADRSAPMRVDPGGFPFGGKEWKDAARSCNAWWNRLVFGREGS
ncbi:MAG TPA: nucleotidyltransferase domain-containing protein [Candidatus Krumholzibacterium sp.]|nr:nucleotidyltransferase domain-containing protein [Candidatus Krumholzibacterium sp.]